MISIFIKRVRLTRQVSILLVMALSSLILIPSYSQQGETCASNTKGSLCLISQTGNSLCVGQRYSVVYSGPYSVGTWGGNGSLSNKTTSTCSISWSSANPSGGVSASLKDSEGVTVGSIALNGLIINPPPSGLVAGTISGPTSDICINQTPGTLTVSGTTAGAVRYEWYASIISSNLGTKVYESSTPSYTPGSLTQSTYFKVVPYFECGSAISGPFLVIVHNTPPTGYNISAGASEVCPGAGTTISLSGSQTGVTYKLMLQTSIGSGLIVGQLLGNGSPLTFEGVGAGTYNVVATSFGPLVCGTTSMLNSVSIDEKIPGTISATPTSLTMYADEFKQLTASGANSSGYTWSLPNGTTLSGQTITIAPPSTPGTFTYTVSGNESVCNQPKSASVTVTILPAMICPDSEVEYSLLVEDEFTLEQVQWSVEGAGYIKPGSRRSNGVPGSTTFPTRFYATVVWTDAGNGKVIAHASNGNPNVDGHEEWQVTVQRCRAPSPVTSFDVDYGCHYTKITRLSDPPSGVIWYWQIDPQGQSQGYGSGREIIIYSTQAIYLRATYQDEPHKWSKKLLNPSTEENGQITVYHEPPPSLTQANSGRSFVRPYSFNLSVGAVPGATRYQWYSASGIPIFGAKWRAYTTPKLSDNTSYLVSAFAGGCETPDKITVTATFEPPPVIQLAVGSAAYIIPGGTVSLTTTLNYTTYSWRKGDEFGELGPEIGTGPVFTASTPGSYAVIVSKDGIIGFGTSKFFYVPDQLDHNYIRTNTVQTAGAVTLNDANMLSIGNKLQKFVYMDGLGRAIQSVETQGSPQKKDVTIPQVYDPFGREVRKNLPIVTNETEGNFKPQLLTSDGKLTSAALEFYQLANDKIENDSQPYSMIFFEDSPLNRPVEEYGAGREWLEGFRASRFQYLFNLNGDASGEERIIAWKYNSTTNRPERDAGVFIEDGFYKSGALRIKVTIDEQGSVVREYTNKNGQIILKKVKAQANPQGLNSPDGWASTYYVFDDMGNLMTVITPEAVKNLQN